MARLRVRPPPDPLMNETTTQRHTYRNQPIWLKTTSIYHWQTGKWEIKVKPEVPTIDKVFGRRVPQDQAAILKKLAVARLVSRSEQIGNVYTITVWSQRPACFRLSHEEEGVKIDGEIIEW